MNKDIIVNKESAILKIYWLFAICYAFIKWGFWWGILNILIPFSPIVDFIKYAFN